MSEPYWVPMGAAGGLLDPAGYGVALPASPVDGQEYVLVDSLTAPTYAWRLRYNAASAHAEKWEFVGGSPLYVEIAASEGTASTTYVALGTPGPTITVPRAGVYDVVGAFQANAASGTSTAYLSYQIDAVAAADVDAIAAIVGVQPSSLSSSRRKTFAAGAVLAARYRATTSTVTFAARRLSIVPVRLA